MSTVLTKESEKNKKERFEKQAFPLMPMLYRTALRFTRNIQDAEDLVQNTFLRAFNFFDHYTEGTSFKGWIFKIMTNIFINQYRKQAKTPPISPLENLGDDYPNPEELFFENLLDEDIKKAIEELPEIYRIPFLLSTEGFSYKEIAQITNTKIGTVMSRLHRARRLLQAKLHQYAEGKDPNDL